MLVVLDILRGILVVLQVQRYFGCFRGFRVFLVILEVSSCLWPFQRFWVYLGHFKGLGVFSSLYSFEGILFIFFLRFMGILEIFQVQGSFGHFIVLGGVFWSFLGFQIILINFQVSGLFWPFFRFQGYFCHFLGFRGILVIIQVLGLFQSFLGLGVILAIFQVSKGFQ